MNQWTPIARIQELPNGQVTSFQVNEHEVIVYRSEDDIYVYPNLCTHQSVPLSDGHVVNEAIICRLHGAKYDLRTGDCLRSPARANLEPYATAERNGVLYIDCSTQHRNYAHPKPMTIRSLRSHEEQPAMRSSVVK